MCYYVSPRVIIVNCCEGIYGYQQRLSRADFNQYALEVSKSFYSNQSKRKEEGTWNEEEDFIYIQIDRDSILSVILELGLDEYNGSIFPEGKITKEMVEEENDNLAPVVIAALKEAKEKWKN
ncbi:MAG: hypothetical protein WC895_00440 [Candidatus Shapirobacteria bacterium]|jgi:hypothetical protein